MSINVEYLVKIGAVWFCFINTSIGVTRLESFKGLQHQITRVSVPISLFAWNKA